MNFNSAALVISAVSQAQYPNHIGLEIAFVGRSNVGKSSLINTIVNRKGLARTSSEPGKTRTINFYKIDEKLFFVDLPGYGYAKISKSEKEKWGKMIETYLKNREQLACIIMIVDIRHEPTKDDIQMFEWIKYYNYNTIIVCTKADKISRAEVSKNLERTKKILKLSNDNEIIAFSSQTRQGKENLISLIEKYGASQEE